ncbi:MAG: glycosyltransferase [Acidimicrobiales bacterium]
MEIAVAIPTYNRANFLREAIDSILGQTLKPHEIFVCDDGSTDDTQSILNSYGDKIRWTTIENSGPAMARKTAIESTTAPWVALCDSDDIWMPDHLERLMGAVEIWPETDMVFSNSINFSEKGSFGDSKFHTAPAGWWDAFTEKSQASYRSFGNNAYPAMLKFFLLLTTPQIFRRGLYERIGGIDKSMARARAEDAHLSRRLAAHGVVACDEKVTTKIRRHNENYSNDSTSVNESDIEILNLFIKDRLIPDRFIECTLQDIGERNMRLFHTYFWLRDFRKARAIAWRTPREGRDAMFYIKSIIAHTAMGAGK